MFLMGTNDQGQLSLEVVGYLGWDEEKKQLYYEPTEG